jgi:hypothetical protein
MKRLFGTARVRSDVPVARWKTVRAGSVLIVVMGIQCMSSTHARTTAASDYSYFLARHAETGVVKTYVDASWQWANGASNLSPTTQIATPKREAEAQREPIGPETCYSERFRAYIDVNNGLCD